MTGDISKDNLREILISKKDLIIQKWFDTILEAYPIQTKQFLQSQSNQFTNPVGHTYYENLSKLYELLITTKSMATTDEMLNLLDEIIRIRAVQGFSPSDALAFIFDLKAIVMDESIPSVHTQEILDFCNLLDVMALKAFEIYMKCRETIYEIRVKEFERNHYRLLQMAKIISVQTDEPQSEQ